MKSTSVFFAVVVGRVLTGVGEDAMSLLVDNFAGLLMHYALWVYVEGNADVEWLGLAGVVRRRSACWHC